MNSLHWYAVAATAALVVALLPVKAQADMGLKCSEWLKARAGVRYDAQTKDFVAVPGAPPVSREVDEKTSWANWYISGHVASQFMLDKNLQEQGAAVGVAITPTDPKEKALRYLNDVDKFCRGGLQQERRDYDVANIVDLIAMGDLTLRALDVNNMLEHAMEAGKRLGARQR